MHPFITYHLLLCNSTENDRENKGFSEENAAGFPLAENISGLDEGHDHPLY